MNHDLLCLSLSLSLSLWFPFWWVHFRISRVPCTLSQRKNSSNMGKATEIDEGFMSPTATPGNVDGPSYRYSYMNVNDDNEASRSSHSNRSSVRNSESVLRGSSVNGDVFIRGSLLDRNIEAVALEHGTSEKSRDYRGRIRVCTVICDVREKQRADRDTCNRTILCF